VLGAHKEHRLVAVLRAGNAVDKGQVEGGEDARVGGQERRHGVVSRGLPLEGLAVVARELAVPREDAKEVKLDVRVRIHELLHEPRARALDVDAEFLAQLAVEGMARGFAGLELAAGKFPVAGVRLARRPLREQHPAVAPQDDGRSDANNRFPPKRRCGPPPPRGPSALGRPGGARAAHFP
jgi:hypothetical protein